MTNDRHVAVIGAGIVGVSCCIFLQQHGAKVTLIDRLPPGDACSFGNAGSLSWSSNVPIAVPGLLPKVPGWLFRNDGPLTIRWRHLPTLLPWLIRFLKAGNRKQFNLACEALSALHSPALNLHKEMASQAESSHMIHDCDFMHVYTSEREYQQSRYQWDIRTQYGATVETFNADEIQDLEPNLSTRYRRAVQIKEQGFTSDPSALVKSFANAAKKRGASILKSVVTGFDYADNVISAVRTQDQNLPIDAVVMAAGAWSMHLLKPLGINLPLEAERGYHITMNQPDIDFSRTIMETDAMMVATPMQMGARFAGTVELATVDAPPDYKRADMIQRAAKRMFPELTTQPQSRWMGCRPSLPDGLPVIDRAPGFDNLFLAFGNAHTGMIGGPNTGRIAAGMACGQPVNIDTQAFRASRF